MTGFEYIVKAIDIFEADLCSRDGKRRILTVAALAKRIGYSVHHFTRLFASVTGVTPKEYMSGRVLSEVAARIIGTDLPLATLAWDAGFADYETFSRAFKSRFGIPPKRLRELHYIPFKCVERLEPRMTPLDVSLRSRAPETVQEESVHLCGMSFYMDGSEKTFHKPWAMFMQVQRQIENRKTPECFYQYACWSTEGELPGMAIICAVETNGPAEQQPLFVCRTLPPAVYLRFVHKGGFSTLRETYDFIYGEFLASRDIRPVSCWEFQRCGTDADIVEINIPIEII